MSEYIEAGKKLIPKNLTAGFNTIIGAAEIFKMMKNKFYQEYEEIKQANNFQIDIPTSFSSIYQNDIVLEQKKRESKNIKTEHFQKVIGFIKLYQFDKIFHSKNIGEYFYDKTTQVCVIDLEVLTKDQSGNFIQNLGWTSPQKCLNQAVEETSFILLEYFKAKYQQKIYQMNFYYRLVKYKISFTDKLQQGLRMHFQNFTTIENDYKISRKIFFTYRIFKNQQNQEVIKEFLEEQFLQFFVNQKLIGGICEPDINKNLQYLIYSIDWIQSSGEADFALQLLDDLSQYNFNISQCQSQIFQNQRFSVNILIEYKQNNKERCQQAQEWWKKNINEKQNLLIMFQLYILTLGIEFNNGKLKLPNYQPQKRNMLIQILRILNNGKYNYINFHILKLCELQTDKIQIQILEQIENKLINQNKSEIQNHLDIYVQQQQFSLQVDSNNQQILLGYYQRNFFFKKIFLQGSNQIDSIELTQNSLLQQLMTEVKGENQQTLKCDPPKNFYFQVLSKPQFNSNIVTLCISGFLSLNNDKEQQWQNIIQEESGTVISLNWNCSETIDCAKAIAKQIPQFANRTIYALAQGTLNLLKQNPYEKAHNEAVKVGQYLAYLIAEKRIFGDYQINIACHSLGSQIVLECVKVLDKLYTKYPQQYIQEIMFMGGVADTRKLQKRRWNAVAGNIYNVYSSKDQVLTWILKLAKFFDKSCGLQPIQIGYKQVINCDFTYIINGHNDYFPKLQQVLLLSDFNNFNNDLKAIVSNIKEEFDI